MKLRIVIFILTAFVQGCAAHRDYVKVTPVHFVKVVGAGGPKCQGWCPTNPDQAEKFRVEVGNVTFDRISDEAKTHGEDGNAAFLNFGKREIERLGYCKDKEVSMPTGKQKISTVEGWSEFWTDYSCGDTVNAGTGGTRR